MTHRADDPRLDQERDDHTQEIAPDLAYKRLTLVNVVLYGLPQSGDRGWVLIDAGLPGCATGIVRAADARFGEGSRPAAIILTHAHFDHVGSLLTLARRWDSVPIYAHSLELPYLRGQSEYPPPDPTVGGGIMALLAPFMPKGPIDVSRWLQPLPEDGSVPEMPGWQWLATPGHTPGHISLWRAEDRAVIAGDAFVTTCQESAYAVMLQSPELHGPPMYFTPDWISAQASVEKLAALEPELAVTGHGRAMRGEPLQQALRMLADDFQQVAVPARGRTGHEDSAGTLSRPDTRGGRRL